MDGSVVASSFALLFLAEMGDKTQLMTMTLAHRYRAGPVIAGAFAAFALLNLVAISVGEALFRYVPQRVVLLAAAALFLVFAYRSWRDASSLEEQGGATRSGTHGALVASFALIFVAELGDKTQLAMVAMAAGTGAPWSVFVGGTAALWVVALIGVALGRTLLVRIPRLWVHRAAAALFLAFGVLAGAQAVIG